MRQNFVERMCIKNRKIKKKKNREMQVLSTDGYFHSSSQDRPRLC